MRKKNGGQRHKSRTQTMLQKGLECDIGNGAKAGNSGAQSKSQPKPKAVYLRVCVSVCVCLFVCVNNNILNMLTFYFVACAKTCAIYFSMQLFCPPRPRRQLQLQLQLQLHLHQTQPESCSITKHAQRLGQV